MRRIAKRERENYIRRRCSLIKEVNYMDTYTVNLSDRLLQRERERCLRIKP